MNVEQYIERQCPVYVSVKEPTSTVCIKVQKPMDSPQQPAKQRSRKPR